MKRFIIIVLLVVSTIGGVFAQSLVGKWDMDVSALKSTGLTSFTTEFVQSGIVKMTVVYTFTESGISMEFPIVMNGKYEVAGKALNREIIPESIKGSWDLICPTCDKNRLQEARKAAGSNMDQVLKEVIKTVKSEFTSRGMYQQILQLNESTLVIQVPGGSLEVYHRITE